MCYAKPTVHTCPCSSSLDGKKNEQKTPNGHKLFTQHRQFIQYNCRLSWKEEKKPAVALPNTTFRRDVLIFRSIELFALKISRNRLFDTNTSNVPCFMLKTKETVRIFVRLVLKCKSPTTTVEFSLEHEVRKNVQEQTKEHRISLNTPKKFASLVRLN